MHLELVENRLLEFITDLENRYRYYEQEIEKLCHKAIRMAKYHQGLEMH